MCEVVIRSILHYHEKTVIEFDNLVIKYFNI
jgi:hypothetical protein